MQFVCSRGDDAGNKDENSYNDDYDGSEAESNNKDDDDGSEAGSNNEDDEEVNDDESYWLHQSGDVDEELANNGKNLFIFKGRLLFNVCYLQIYHSAFSDQCV